MIRAARHLLLSGKMSQLRPQFVRSFVITTTPRFSELDTFIVKSLTDRGYSDEEASAQIAKIKEAGVPNKDVLFALKEEDFRELGIPPVVSRIVQTSIEEAKSEQKTEAFQERAKLARTISRGRRFHGIGKIEILLCIRVV